MISKSWLNFQSISIEIFTNYTLFFDHVDNFDAISNIASNEVRRYWVQRRMRQDLLHYSMWRCLSMAFQCLPNSMKKKNTTAINRSCCMDLGIKSIVFPTFTRKFSRFLPRKLMYSGWFFNFSPNYRFLPTKGTQKWNKKSWIFTPSKSFSFDLMSFSSQ